MKENAYRNIFKATAVFGGVQVFKILITIIRSKFIAVLLGPAGMGINSLLTSTLGIISGLTNFGLATSAVKNVAAANATGDENRIATVVSVFRSWVWITGLLGFITALILSPWLSKLAFGNYDYTIAFALVSVTLLITQISAGQSVILRGMRQIKLMAQSDLIGSVVGLFVSIPLYYFFVNKGIVPAILITAITGLLLTWYFARKVPVKSVSVTVKTIFAEGREMLAMGFMLSLSSLIAMGTSYILRIFITKHGSITDVGLYSAGFAMINSYVGLIFTALSTDYYPRLAGVAHDKVKASREINQQAEIAILIMAPIICFFLIFINWAVILLYSHKFISIGSMVHWVALGIFFKASSWALGFLILARGASKVFFWNELITNVYMLILDIAGYYFWGLTGLGISFFITYLLYLIQMVILTKTLYQFSFDKHFIRIFLLQSCLALSCFLTSFFFHSWLAYLIGGIFICCSVFYSIYEMDKRLGLKQILKRFKNKSPKKEEHNLPINP